MISVFPDLEQLSQAAANLIAQHALDVTAKEEKFTIALAGGHTPTRTYELLATEPTRSRVPWANVHIFWGDERFVPSDDDRANQSMAREVLLNHVPIPPGQIHPIECEGTPTQGANRYEQCLLEYLGPAGRFALILLGLGEDGHTASLFPHSTVLGERTRWVAGVPGGRHDLSRITLTPPIINRAQRILFLVSGPNKADALWAVFRGPHDTQRRPAQVICPIDGEPHWLVDQAAARRLVVMKPTPSAGELDAPPSIHT